MTTRLGGAVLFAVLLAGCHHAAAPEITGDYTGTLQAGVGSANLNVTLSDFQGVLSGRASGTGLGFTSLAYFVSGSHQDGVATFSISPNYDDGSNASHYGGVCVYKLAGNSEGGALRGTFTTSGCQEAATGTFVLQRK